MFKIILGTLLRIIAIYIGMFAGIVSTYLAFYYENIVYFRGGYGLWLSFFLSNIVMFIQISVLVPVAWFVTKMLRIRLFSFAYCNFGIGFLFSLLSLLLLFAVSKVRILSQITYLSHNIWFDFVILPIIVFIPLMYVVHLLLSRKKRQ